MTFISILIGRRGNTVDNTVILTNVFNLEEFYFFEKKGIQELCRFIARTGFSKSVKGKITNVQHKDFYFTVMTDFRGLSICAVFNDNKYPIRVLHRVLRDILNIYVCKHGNKWEIINNDLQLPLKNLHNKLLEVSDPKKIDKIYKINKDLENTKLLMHQNIDKVLDRGEKIEDLVERSKDLSKTSKSFYRTTKKFNRCCILS